MSNQGTAILYGDVSPNIIDGSSVWLISMAETLSRIFSRVIVPLKDKPHDQRLYSRLQSLTGVIAVIPETAEAQDLPLSPHDAVRAIAGLTAEHDPDVVVVRGGEVCFRAISHPAVADKLWAYVTDLPYPLTKISKTSLNRLQQISRRCRRLFCQTEESRSYLEAIAPEAAGKCVLLNPMIPDEYFAEHESRRPSRRGGETAHLVYSGKFAKPWLTRELIALPRQLRERGLAADLRMIGDKFQKDQSDTAWHVRMRHDLEEAATDPASGVEWLGGMTRSAALAEVVEADYGLGWRTRELNASLELSTKLLEYCAVGVLPVVNRNAIHEALLGSDYPLFIEDSTVDDVVRAITEFEKNGDRPGTVQWVRDAADYYSVSATAERLSRAFGRAGVLHSAEVQAAGGAGNRRIKIVVASHDFKFMGEILSQLRSDTRFDVQLDVWRTLHAHDDKRSTELLEWADVILCEWCGPNAGWYSRNKRNGQKLVVRLHRFEVNGAWMPRIDYAAIDHMIYVSDLQREDSERIVPALRSTPARIIPNTLDCADLHRAKFSGSQFHLGVLGIVPFVKRPDRALDLLEGLRTTDERYVLHLRGRMPWEYPHEWNKPLQQQMYLDFFRRIRESERLRRGVVFEPFGADIGSWLRKIGVILSPSAFESFHLACAEGMASGAMPVVWSRAGADAIFGVDNIYSAGAPMRNAVIALQDPAVRASQSGAAMSRARGWDIMTVYPQWRELLAG